MEITTESEYLQVISAGYGDDGNDRNGHMHVHHLGSFYRHDGVRGFYCAAPVDYVEGDYFCTDPIPFADRSETIELGSNPAQGGQFMFKGESHEIIGFYTGSNFSHWMYSFVTNDPDNLRYIYKWAQMGKEQKYSLEIASVFTVLDAVDYFIRTKGL